MSALSKLENIGSPLLVTAAVIFDGDKVLITRRPDDGCHPGEWEFPGGKVDPGEGPHDALRREIMEELAADVSVDEIFEVVYYRYEWGAVLILAYRCRLLSPTIRHIGVADHRWVRPVELSNYSILPADQPIIDRLNLLPG